MTGSSEGTHVDYCTAKIAKIAKIESHRAITLVRVVSQSVIRGQVF